MTPEERAANLESAITDNFGLPDYAREDVRSWIAGVIREAVAEERERCAKVAWWVVDDIDPQGHYVYEAIMRGEQPKGYTDPSRPPEPEGGGG